MTTTNTTTTNVTGKMVVDFNYDLIATNSDISTASAVFDADVCIWSDGKEYNFEVYNYENCDNTSYFKTNYRKRTGQFCKVIPIECINNIKALYETGSFIIKDFGHMLRYAEMFKIMHPTFITFYDENGNEVASGVIPKNNNIERYNKEMLSKPIIFGMTFTSSSPIEDSEHYIINYVNNHVYFPIFGFNTTKIGKDIRTKLTDHGNNKYTIEIFADNWAENSTAWYFMKRLEALHTKAFLPIYIKYCYDAKNDYFMKTAYITNIEEIFIGHNHFNYLFGPNVYIDNDDAKELSNHLVIYHGLCKLNIDSVKNDNIAKVLKQKEKAIFGTKASDIRVIDNMYTAFTGSSLVDDIINEYK